MRLNFCLIILCQLLPFIRCELFYLTKENGEFKVRNRSVEPETQWLSEASYKNAINTTGFAYIEIKGNPILVDDYQAYTAGYLEGKITSDLIYSQWFNTVNDFKTTMKSSVVDVVDEFLKKNTQFVLEQVKANKNDSYWYHVGLFYRQLTGMYDGYKSNNDSSEKLEFVDFLWLTLFYDLLDLYDGLAEESTDDTHCSVLIKILPENNDIYFGHNTWTTYQNMLRLQKKYILNYRKSLHSRDNVPGTVTAFTGYPGSLGSMDDFYLISSGLAVTETTNSIFNRTLWESLTPNCILGNVRSVVANRLASDGETWNRIFQPFNSGTYNNQWIILDYKRFKPGRAPTKGAFWVIEQIPSKIVANDLTDVLINKGYWISYNIPYYKEIYELSGYTEQYKKYGNWFSYDNAPRPSIFKRDQAKVSDMESYMKLMRSNDYRNDPFARCECQPPYSAAGAIAARNDLNPTNGSYQFQGQGHRPSGAIDAKITNSSLFLQLQFIAVSGPTTGTNGQLPVFSWSKSGFNETPCLSHPDVWDFKPVLYKWKLT